MVNESTEGLQSLVTDDFLYFYLRLRKTRIRSVVQTLRARFPGETREELARRVIASHTQLSALGGVLIQLPLLLPGIGETLKVLGLVGGVSAFARAHIYLILEIALLYDQDIDDQARVPEIMAVVAGAAGVTVGPSLLVGAVGLNPIFSLPVAFVTAAGLAQEIGGRAIQYYTERLDEEPARLGRQKRPGINGQKRLATNRQKRPRLAGKNARSSPNPEYQTDPATS